MIEISRDLSPLYFHHTKGQIQVLANWEQTKYVASSLEIMLPDHIDEVMSIIESDPRSIKYISIDGEMFSIFQAKFISKSSNPKLTTLNVSTQTIPCGYVCTKEVPNTIHLPNVIYFDLQKDKVTITT